MGGGGFTVCPMDSPVTAPAASPRRFDHLFRWRCKEVSRVEAIADAVFGLVLAMLLLREHPPESLAQLSVALKSLIPFAITFTVITTIWFEHFLFFRRYDLHDAATIVLTFVLLFLVLFYAYPLKLVFTLLTVMAFGPIGEQTYASMTAGAECNPLAIYSTGFGLVYLTFAALYWNALRQQRDLSLSAVEVFLSRSALVQCLIYVAMAVVSVLLAVFGYGEGFGLPGWIYFLIGPAMGVHGSWQGRRLRALGAA